eukprot:scaffold412_cov388-Prasinococcus_capsulatus_cf.AAC.27
MKGLRLCCTLVHNFVASVTFDCASAAVPSGMAAQLGAGLGPVVCKLHPLPCPVGKSGPRQSQKDRHMLETESGSCPVLLTKRKELSVPGCRAQGLHLDQSGLWCIQTPRTYRHPLPRHPLVSTPPPQLLPATYATVKARILLEAHSPHIPATNVGGIRHACCAAHASQRRASVSQP